MSKIQGNAEGKIGGFEKMPEGERLLVVDDFVQVEDKTTKAIDPLKMMLKLSSDEYQMVQFVNADKPKSLETFLTIIHFSGIAKKLADKNAAKYGANILKDGWDDSVFLQKDGSGKVIGFEPKFILGIKAVKDGCKFMGEIKHVQAKGETYVNLIRAWAYNPNKPNTSTQPGAPVSTQATDDNEF